jgi:hypothetical protein
MCTITILEKLIGAIFFNGSNGHLTYCHAILLISSGGLGLPFVVQTTTLAFLGCWALITLTFATCF